MKMEEVPFYSQGYSQEYKFPDRTVLEEAAEVVDSRNDNYGHPSTNFRNIADLWTVILGIPVSMEQVGLCMIALKIARQIHKPNRDNLVDMAGYVRTIEKLQTP